MVDVPTCWDTLDDDADAALTEVAIQARDAVATAGDDPDAVRAALLDLYRGWKGLQERFEEVGILDTDVRECVGAFFDELVAASACDLDAGTVWAECSLGLLRGPPIPALGDSLAEPGDARALVEAIESALPDPVDLPGLGVLDVRYRPALPGPFYASPADRMRALAAGEQVGMPAQIMFRFKAAQDARAALDDPASVVIDAASPLATALGEERLRTVVEALMKSLGPGRSRVEVAGELVFLRSDRPAMMGRNPMTGEELTIPGRTALTVHPRRALKERVTARCAEAFEG